MRTKRKDSTGSLETSLSKSLQVEGPGVPGGRCSGGRGSEAVDTEGT